MALVTSILLPSSASAAPSTNADQQTVRFSGVTVQVPAAWPIVNVGGVPGCIRYDEPAVFLGTPSESTCPAHVTDRTTTVQILRGHTSAAFAPTVTTDASGDFVVSTHGQPRLIVTTDPDTPTTASEIVTGATVDSHHVSMTEPSTTAGATAAPLSVEPRVAAQRSQPMSSENLRLPVNAPPPVTRATFSGKAFDSCTAQPLSTMKAWKNDSPYGAVGIYIGGVSRGCPQPNLTPQWVTSVHSMGWHTLPLYVGRQAPCSNYRHTISTKTAQAERQGLDAAADAVLQMNALGFAQGDPVYFDMEAWSHKDATCSAAVTSFVAGWVRGLHSAGYLAGFYTSSDYGLPALVDAVQNDPTYPAPDAVWFARWDEDGTGTGDPMVPDSLWSDHQRVKQYRGGHNETHGGVTVNIDSSVVDGPVTGVLVSISPSTLPTAFPGEPYRADVLGSGGKPPYTFSVASGALPAGLTLAKDGRITGTPTEGGVIQTVTIKVSDSAKPAHTDLHAYRMYVSFTDIPADHEFYPTVTWLARSGITFGYPDGTFKPTAGVTRGAMAAFLFRDSHPNTPPTDCTSAAFPDVGPDAKFCGHISWLKGQHITFGYPDGEFKPDNMVTRGAMAAFLYRFEHPGEQAPACTTKPFPDVEVTDQFCGHITWLKNAGLTVGYQDGEFKADNTVTRGAMSAFLDRLGR